MGIIGKRRGVVMRWVLGVLLGGFSLGWALLNPGLGIQAEGEIGDLLANFVKVGLESSVLCVGNGASPHVTSLVVAVNTAFGTDVPAGAHEGFFISLRRIPRAFPSKIILPNIAFFHQEFSDVAKVFLQCAPLQLHWASSFFLSFVCHCPRAWLWLRLLEFWEGG